MTSNRLAFIAYVVGLLAVAGASTYFNLPLWQGVLITLVVIAVIGGAFSYRRRK